MNGDAQLALADATTAYHTLAGWPFAYNYTGFVLGTAGYTTLTTASSSSVTVIGATDTTFAGNILALASVGLDPRAEILCGRAFALTGAVTLIDNLISNNNTAEDFGSDRSDFGSYGFSGGGAALAVPEPGTLTLLGMGLRAGFLLLRKFRSIR